MLTTIDNPYNPNDDYDLWYQYDHDHGYNTNEYLARIANVPQDASDDERDALIQDAIEEILKINLFGLWKLAS